MTAKALILFAHGARDPEWARPVQAVAQRLQLQNPDLLISVSFLEFMQPTLEQCVAQMHAAMSSQQSDEAPLRIDILPFFIAQGGHLRNEVPVMLQTLQASYPQIHFRLLPALGELPSVQDAMARAIGGLIA